MDFRPRQGAGAKAQQCYFEPTATQDWAKRRAGTPSVTGDVEFGENLLALARSRSAGAAVRGGLSAYVKRSATKPGAKGAVGNAGSVVDGVLGFSVFLWIALSLSLFQPFGL